MGLDEIHIDGLIYPRFLLYFVMIYQRRQTRGRRKIWEAGVGFFLWNESRTALVCQVIPAPFSSCLVLLSLLGFKPWLLLSLILSLLSQICSLPGSIIFCWLSQKPEVNPDSSLSLVLSPWPTSKSHSNLPQPASPFSSKATPLIKVLYILIWSTWSPCPGFQASSIQN